MTEGIPYGDYFLLGRLNQGGMAEVFLGKSRLPDAASDRLLAIKRLLPSYSEDPELVRMFVDEARIAKKLHHPNICEVLDEGRESNQLFLVMEFVHGKDLKVVHHRVQKSGEAMPYRLVAFIMAKVAEALEYAHSRKSRTGEPEHIVHRDVSPQNILISYDGTPKLIDFGIAKAKDRLAQTRVGVVKGKFGYIAPEQASGGVVDARSDIFALGVVLYELLVGQPPFKGTNDLSTLKRVSKAEYAAVHVVNPDVPRALADIAERALSKEPAKRHASAAEFSSDLMRYLRDSKQAVDEAVLSAYMRKLFSEDYAREIARVKQYRAAKVPKREHTDTRPGIPPVEPLVLPEGRTEVAPTFMLAAGFGADGSEGEPPKAPMVRRRDSDEHLFDFRPFSDDEITRPPQPNPMVWGEVTRPSDVSLNPAAPLLEEKTSVMPPSIEVVRTPLPRRPPPELRAQQLDAAKTPPDGQDARGYRDSTDKNDIRLPPGGFTNEITKEELLIPIPEQLRDPRALDKVLDALEEKPPVGPEDQTNPVPQSTLGIEDKPRTPEPSMLPNATQLAPILMANEPTTDEHEVPDTRNELKIEPIGGRSAEEDLAKFAAALAKRPSGGQAAATRPAGSPFISRGEAVVLVIATVLGMMVVGVSYLYALKAPLPDPPTVEDVNARLR